MNDFAEQYAENVLAFYRTLLRQDQSWDFAKDLTIKAVPYLMPCQSDQEPGFKEEV